MDKEIGLIWLDNRGSVPQWPLGSVYTAGPTPSALHDALLRRLQLSTAEAWLFWDPYLGMPDPARVKQAMSQPGDVWHAGLRLGMGGLPHLMDFVAPTWMLNRDPAPSCDASSWRLSLQACLVRTDVLSELGLLLPAFRTLTGAALEMGHRYLMNGALVRYIPSLLSSEPSLPSPVLPLEDELYFVRCRFGRLWYQWSLLRSLLTGAATPKDLIRAHRDVTRLPLGSQAYSRRIRSDNSSINVGATRVSVLIPTLERYTYLRPLLNQLGQQSVKPYEIIIVDQTPSTLRDDRLTVDFSDLPLKILHCNQIGQCSSRNAGLRIVEGNYVLFLDDDVEVGPSFIRDHLHSLSLFGADVICGAVYEVGNSSVQDLLSSPRISDVFPLGNTLINRGILLRSGLLDLAYERGSRADSDLGMRIYLSGALMIFDPTIRILHHRAPRGGLRVHRARVITYASSRKSLLQRHVPSVSEIYLAMRYFSSTQVREMLWMRTCETFSIRGSILRKSLKLVFSLTCLPHTLWQICQRYRQASRMLEVYPQIPSLAGSEAEFRSL